MDWPRTPVLMVRGRSTKPRWRRGDENDAGVVLRLQEGTTASMACAMARALHPMVTARTARLHDLVGPAGRERAVEAILRTIDETIRS